MKGKRTTRSRYSASFGNFNRTGDLGRGADRHLALQGANLVRAWAEFLHCVPWQTLVTMTFDPKRVFPVSQERALREAEAWCKVVSWALRRPIAWAIAAERSRSGQWHVHILIAGVGPSQLDAPGALWQSRNGNLDIRLVHDGRGVTLYASKEAALTGSIIFSDTIGRYMDGDRVGRLVAHQMVRLYPESGKQAKPASHSQIP